MRTNTREVLPSKTRKPFFLFLILIFLSCVILISSFTATIRYIRSAVGYILLPSQKTFSAFFDASKEADTRIRRLFFLYKKQEDYEKNMIRLKNMEQRFAALMEENLKLKEMLGYLNASNSSLVAARVIGRITDDEYQIVMIDKGKKYNIREGCPVVVGKYPFPSLVGQVIETGSRYAKVLLITDINSAVSAYLVSSNVDGIVEGQNGNMIVMRHFDSDLTIMKNDIVITSGLGGIFPYGLYIGKVRERLDRPDESIDLVIEPEVDIRHIRDVFVMIGGKK